MRRLFLICVGLCVGVFRSLPAMAAVEGTPHDLSAIGGGNTCSFCHTPHGSIAGTPLWNHALSNAVYKIYQSTSLDAKIGQPTGSSKLCLSCHDGTVALTETLSGNQGAPRFIPEGKSNLGTDLSDDHPISFVYPAQVLSAHMNIRPASMLPSSLSLDRHGEIQCTTCHDPHDNRYGKFMTMPNRRSQMCVSCHEMRGWTECSHEKSAAAAAAASDTYLQQTGYATVADNGCLSCHRPHSAGGRERLLHFDQEEQNCLNCHNGSVARTNLAGELLKYSRHDVKAFTRVHDPQEIPLSMPRHVECADCHNPHAVMPAGAAGAGSMGTLRDVSGISISGGVVDQVSHEYEVCFKCHGDSAERGNLQIPRQYSQFNTRLEFQPASISFHPVVVQGKNPRVPSLRSPLTVTSLIKCTDCHSSESNSSVKGPHGSNIPHLLSARYETAVHVSESSTSYELCYKCHSRNSLLNNESFSKHKEHIERTSCSTCHDPHGITSFQGNETNNRHLIHFNTDAVTPGSNGRMEFEDKGTFVGTCSLRCHQEDHNNASY